MESAPSSNVNIPPDRDRDNFSSSLIEGSAASSSTEAAAANMTATAVSLPSANNQLVLYTERPQFSSTTSVASSTSQPSHATSSSSSSSTTTAPIEKLSRPMAFDKVKKSSFYHFYSFSLSSNHDESLSCIYITHLSLKLCDKKPRGYMKILSILSTSLSFSVH